MVVSQQLVQEIQGLRTDKVLVFTVDKAFPSLTRVSVESKRGMRNGPWRARDQHFILTFSSVAMRPANSKEVSKTKDSSLVLHCHWRDIKGNWRDENSSVAEEKCGS